MNNYEIARDRAQAYFLQFDQQAILEQWHLPHDDRNLYADFFGKPYGIDRKTGVVTRLFDGQTAGFEEVLTIFDFLCHEGHTKTLSGQFAPVNSLKGAPKTGGVGTSFHARYALQFDRDPAAFAEACRQLGGTAVPMGDLGFRFPVFGALDVILKFYGSDEDFPPAVTLLWDANTLQYLFYETVFYAAGFLLSSLAQIISPNT